MIPLILLNRVCLLACLPVAACLLACLPSCLSLSVPDSVCLFVYVCFCLCMHASVGLVRLQPGSFAGLIPFIHNQTMNSHLLPWILVRPGTLHHNVLQSNMSIEDRVCKKLRTRLANSDVECNYETRLHFLNLTCKSPTALWSDSIQFLLQEIDIFVLPCAQRLKHRPDSVRSTPSTGQFVGHIMGDDYLPPAHVVEP